MVTAKWIIENGLMGAAEELMDDELREEVCEMLCPCEDEAFLEQYMELHEAKYGIPFCV